mmetsp:Transcript_137/g.217  ORF Transcript_137/g.217 Transcript_137/m.217 type:complete len:252 (-) Transcript_137:414-1169(-)
MVSNRISTSFWALYTSDAESPPGRMRSIIAATSRLLMSVLTADAGLPPPPPLYPATRWEMAVIQRSLTSSCFMRSSATSASRVSCFLRSRFNRSLSDPASARLDRQRRRSATCSISFAFAIIFLSASRSSAPWNGTARGMSARTLSKASNSVSRASPKAARASARVMYTPAAPSAAEPARLRAFFMQSSARSSTRLMCDSSSSLNSPDCASPMTCCRTLTAASSNSSMACRVCRTTSSVHVFASRGISRVQ